MATTSSALESPAINRISYRMALLDLCVNVAEGNVRIEATLHAQMVCHADHLLDRWCHISSVSCCRICDVWTTSTLRCRFRDETSPISIFHRTVRSPLLLYTLITPCECTRLTFCPLYRRFVFAKQQATLESTLICVVRENQVIPAHTFWAGHVHHDHARHMEMY